MREVMVRMKRRRYRVRIDGVGMGKLIWISQVLCFEAFFKQTIHESPLEHFRVRYVKVCLSTIFDAQYLFF